MSTDDYDDGLVHSHHWAKEPPPSGVILAPRPPQQVHDAKVADAMNRRQAEG